MDVENDTDREVEYEQTGGTGNVELPAAGLGHGAPARTAGCSGKLPAKGGKASFSPCGSSPWTVRFKMDGTVIATADSITDTNARVRLGVVVF